MRIPRTITILGREIKIIMLGTKEMERICGAGNAGMFMSGDNTIYIWKRQPLEKRYQVLFHEAAHACLSITGADQKLSEGLEEVVCESMSNAMIDLQKSLRQYPF